MAAIPRKVIKGKEIDFLVLNRHLVKASLPREPHVVISITDTKKNHPRLPVNEKREGVLRLKFDDYEKIPEGMRASDCKLFSKADAAEIKEFIQDHRDKIDLIVCHCEAGISRSSAVAAALHKWIEGTQGHFFTDYRPNQLVFDVLSEVLRSKSA